MKICMKRSATQFVLLWLVTLLIFTPTSNAHSKVVNVYLEPEKEHHIASNHASTNELSGHMAVQFDGDEHEARAVAEKFGLELVGKVFDSPIPVYHLHKREGRERRAFNPYIEEEIRQQPKVQWAEQQFYLHRDKRSRHLMKPTPRFLRSKPTSRFLRSKIVNVLNDHEEKENRLLRKKIAESYSRERRHFIEWLDNNGYSRSKRIHSKVREKKMKHFDVEQDVEVTTVSSSQETPEKYKTEENTTNKKIEFEDWLETLIENDMEFNDPFYKDQWYLHNNGQLGQSGGDLNITWAWRQGFTGSGVVVSILDDGIQGENEDLKPNFAANISYNVVRDGRNSSDASPRMDPSASNSHGTYCAAVVAAVANNSVCGVGVAYNAKIGGVRIVDGRVTDVQEATALSKHNKVVDIFSASWGPTDNGATVEGPGKLADQAFKEGIAQGRDGKGAIFVWASGNGGIFGDNCNLDGYTSSRFTLSVSSVTDRGESTYYGEPCASTLAAVYVGGSHLRGERNKRNIQVVVPELDGHCSEHFQGTSAAAPLMAGIVALALEANPSLTWRDIQQLVIEASAPTTDALKEEGWETNGIGKMFHLMQGYGAINGGRMVELALNWKNLPPQKTAIIPMLNGNTNTNGSGWYNISHLVDMSQVPAKFAITSLEHIEANVTLDTSKRQLWSIYIISPQGTKSQVLTHRSSDTQGTGFNDWPFMSVHFWGENPNGLWTVSLWDQSGDIGNLKKVALTLYGI